MKWAGCVFPCLLLIGSFRSLAGDLLTPDRGEVTGRDESVHPDVLGEGTAEVLEAVGDSVVDTEKDDYEDADWHPPPSLLESHAHLAPNTPLVLLSNNNAASSQEACGESSGRLTADGRCQLIATRPYGGTAQKHCPDPFRCTNSASRWRQQSDDRRQQLQELKETMSALQEELRSHRHRLRALESQDEETHRFTLTFDLQLRSLKLRHSEADTLLHVHAALLHELQAHIHNLSASVKRRAANTANTGCSVKLQRNTPPLSMRDTVTTVGRSLSLCPSDCASLYVSGVHRSGVYSVVLWPGSSVPVYCDMETEGGGWTVFQRRHNGSLSFNRGWLEYRDGFGEPRGEHWLGNQQLHLLSTQGHYSLRIELQDWSHAHKHATYHTFRIDGEASLYRLHVSGFSGTVKDSFGWYHDQRVFSTPDTGNICAEISHAGWWFHQCFYSNLNGVYYKGGRYSLKAHNLLGPDGVVWFSWKDSDFYSLKSVTMMMRPRTFRPRLSP